MRSIISRKIYFGILLSTASYISFSILKCIVGVNSNSQAVLADGLNNISDVLLSIAIFIGLRVSFKPADSNHPFGHHRAENVAILVAASFMLLVSFQLSIEAIKSFFMDDAKNISPIAFYVSMGSALWMVVISQVNFYLYRKSGSEVLKASAVDSRSDALVSIGAAVGIIGTYQGYPWIDPLAALLVSITILITAIKIGWPVVNSLMDGFDEGELKKIKDVILSIDGIYGVNHIRARNHGSSILVEVTVVVKPYLSVYESHLLTEHIEERLIGYSNIEHVHIHVEPKS